MPTYDYRCNPCDITTEHLHAMSVTPDLRCPQCGAPMVKLVGRPPFKFADRQGMFIRPGGAHMDDHRKLT